MTGQNNIPDPASRTEPRSGAGALPGIAARLADIRRRIREAALRAGRNPDDVELVAVTKGHHVSAMEELLAAGHTLVGENRVQEFAVKRGAIGDRARWHFIGRLQRNKARDIVGRVELLHTLDSLRLLDELEAKCAAAHRPLDVLIQVNIGNDPAKTGFDADEIPSVIDALAGCSRVRALGFMTIPPLFEDPEKARPLFRALRERMARQSPSRGFEPRHLSMGMSDDFEIAVEEGATLVRVGTALMGERPEKG